MRNRRRIWVVSVLGALALCLGVYLWPSREPHYNERPLSDWLAQWEKNLSSFPPTPLTPEEQQVLTVVTADTNAIPHLLKWVRYTLPPEPVLGAVYQAVNWLNSAWANWLVTKWYSAAPHTAAMVLKMMGPKASSALPELERLLIHPPDEQVRFRVKTILATVGPLSASAVRELERLLINPPQDSDRNDAGYVLGHQGALGLPVLIAALTNTNPAVRYVGASCLGYQTNNAHLVIPLLLKALTDPELKVAESARGALVDLRAHPDLIVPGLIRWLNDPDWERRISAVRCFRSRTYYRKAAASALPDLLEALKDSEAKIRTDAAEVLMLIAPEVLCAQEPILYSQMVRKKAKE